MIVLLVCVFLICDFVQRGFRDKWLSSDWGFVLGNYLRLMVVAELCVSQPRLYMLTNKDIVVGN